MFFLEKTDLATMWSEASVEILEMSLQSTIGLVDCGFGVEVRPGANILNQ